MTQTADHYLRLEIGNLVVTNALLRAENDQLRERLAQAERALERAAQVAPDPER